MLVEIRDIRHAPIEAGKLVLRLVPHGEVNAEIGCGIVPFSGGYACAYGKGKVIAVIGADNALGLYPEVCPVSCRDKFVYIITLCA